MRDILRCSSVTEILSGLGCPQRGISLKTVSRDWPVATDNGDVQGRITDSEAFNLCRHEFPSTIYASLVTVVRSTWKRMFINRAQVIKNI